MSFEEPAYFKFNGGYYHNECFEYDKIDGSNFDENDLAEEDLN